MEHEFPEPPKPVSTHDKEFTEQAKRRVRRTPAAQDPPLHHELRTGNRGTRWLITAAFIFGGRVLVGMFTDQGEASSAADSACVDATKFEEEVTALDYWYTETKVAIKAKDLPRVEGDLRTIGGILDSLAAISASDPEVAGKIRESAADAGAAADALADGRLVEANGHVFALNADWSAAEQAGAASRVPAC
jgi:hypothetical protein